MADIRLLKLIDSMSNDMGHASSKAVEAAYGEGYKRAVAEAWDAGYLDRLGPIEGHKLSNLGRDLARR